MADEQGRSAAIAIDKVRISGLAAPVRETGLRQAISTALSDGLAGSVAPSHGPARIEIQRLALRLPHAAGSEDVARALRQAIARALRGERL